MKKAASLYGQWSRKTASQFTTRLPQSIVRALLLEPAARRVHTVHIARHPNLDGSTFPEAATGTRIPADAPPGRLQGLRVVGNRTELQARFRERAVGVVHVPAHQLRDLYDRPALAYDQCDQLP